MQHPYTFGDEGGTFRFIAPNTLFVENEPFDVTDPKARKTMWSRLGGNVECLLDVWLIDMAPKWAMYLMKHLYPLGDQRQMALALETDLDGNPQPFSTSKEQHELVTLLYRDGLH